MVKLTEEMIVARTRVSEMGNVKKLNCWGAELTDVSVLRNLCNVEVLSLSVNCITTLSDIQHCKNLQELYIRKNQIQDLSEICWLRNLTKLKNLWLEENPCAQGGDIYRMTVIKNLPQLQKLDNSVVQPDEVSEAMRRGVELIHPHDRSLVVDDGYGNGSYSYQESKQPMAEMHAYEEPQPPPLNQYYEENISSQARDRRSSSYLAEKVELPSNQAAPSTYGDCPSRRVSNQVFDPPILSRSSQPVFQSRDVVEQQGGYSSRRSSHAVYDDGYAPEYHTGRRYSQDQPTGTQGRRSIGRQPQHSSLDEHMRRMSVQPQRDYETSDNTYYVDQSYSSTAEVSRSLVAQHYEQTYDTVNQQIESARQLVEERKMSKPSPERPYPRRPKNRNSNILSAVLCLIKELDGPSLEVAEMAVRCRMEELED